MTGRKQTRQLVMTGIPAARLPVFRGLTALALAFALAVPAPGAQAQALPGDQPVPEPRQGESVTKRSRPDFDPRGVRAGNFLVFPKLVVTAMSDDNIFSDSSGEVEDSIAVISPGVEIESNFNNHALNFEAGVDIGRYADEDGEDYDDFNLGFDGRLDIRRTSNLFGDVRLQSLHEDRGSPDDVNGISPTEFDIRSANFGYFQRFNRLSVRVQGIFDQYDFDDTPTTLTVINNDDRDRDVSRTSLRFAYQIVPNYDAVFSVAHRQTDYDSTLDDDGFNRDSDRQDFAIGVAIDLAGLTTAEFLIGSVSQDFDDARLEDIDDPVFSLELSWNVTRLTTVEAFAVRNVQETTVIGASANLQSRAGLSVDHELRRNLLVNLRLVDTREEFVGTDRTDRVHEAIVDVKWLINPNYYTGIRYLFRKRESDLATDEFEKNRVVVQLGYQL